jgi:hypothetical protein
MNTPANTHATLEALITQAALEALMRDHGYTNLTLTVAEALQAIEDHVQAQTTKSNHDKACLQTARGAAKPGLQQWDNVWQINYLASECDIRGGSDIALGHALRNLQFAVRREWERPEAQ